MDTYVTAPERLGETVLTDGRTLAWAEWGPRDGHPVLFVPGAATSRRLGIGAGAAEALGVRLVSVDRPGLGASSPDPGHTFADFADDIADLARRRGLGRPPVVGNSQGAPFALACTVAGVTGPAALVSAADEVAHPAFADALPDDLRSLVDRVAADPEGARSFLRGLGPEAMWSMVTGGAPDSDLAVYRSPAFEAAYLAALEEGFAGGGDGYARDTVLAMGRWSFDPAAVTEPVDLWYGAEDTVHSPDNGATLASRIPGAELHVVPGVGGAVLWTEAGRILSVLLERAAA
ncbi:alpha/beta fold hydrolase [Nocardiopsis sp. FIRDI 009]|uniref:alpha/beta fold hydrolase n=1 Tax=Nocardiopsis sp. FIRDI 009 TaxID=714197 RepID=UPI000E251AAD|nr:alpha/beta hydrolase [Nocardiopsis sp. FIRDI 009]